MATTTLPYPDPKNSTQYADDLDAAIELELGKPIHLTAADTAVTTAWVNAESPTFPAPM